VPVCVSPLILQAIFPYNLVSFYANVILYRVIGYNP